MNELKLVRADIWRELEPFLGKDVPDGEVVMLSDVKAMIESAPPAPSGEGGWINAHIRTVPDTFDVISWRGKYYHLQENEVPAVLNAHVFASVLRKQILALPKHSFFLSEHGGVRCVNDSTGNWIRWDEAARLCEVEHVDAVLSAAPSPAEPN